MSQIQFFLTVTVCPSRMFQALCWLFLFTRYRSSCSLRSEADLMEKPDCQRYKSLAVSLSEDLVNSHRLYWSRKSLAKALEISDVNIYGWWSLESATKSLKLGSMLLLKQAKFYHVLGFGNVVRFKASCSAISWNSSLPKLSVCAQLTSKSYHMGWSSLSSQ